MKILIKLLFLLLIQAPAFAQLNYVDSLRLQLNSTSSDTIRAQTLTDIAFDYMEKNRDSSLLYSEQLINQGESMKNPMVKVVGLCMKSYAQFHKTELLQSFKSANEALMMLRNKETKKVKWVPTYAFVKTNLKETIMGFEGFTTTLYAFIYGSSGNITKAIEYYKKAIETANLTSNKRGVLASCMNLGYVYFGANLQDSALFYTHKALQHSLDIGETYFRGNIYSKIGDIKFATNQFDSARYYYLNGYSLAHKAQFELGKVQSLLGLAHYYKQTQQVDSMHLYAKDAYIVSNEMRAIGAKTTAMVLIAQAFKMQGKLDSAYYYMSVSKTVGDSLSKERDKKRLEFQSFSFEEQLRLEKIEQDNISFRNKVRTMAMIAGLCIVSLLAWIFYRNNRRKHSANKVLEATLNNLQETQTQLIQSEKMASLGELTAGIAHEIQNPLNFVNNFSEVNSELVDELNLELNKPDIEEAKVIANDIKQNLAKINHHGKRADSIVKGMLQHSRKSEGKKEPTDINALCDEYLRLAYHGLRAKDKSFNANLKSDFDNSIGAINIIPQDIGRVLLNLVTNAFYAVNERLRQAQPDNHHAKVADNQDELNEVQYKPTISISTKKTTNSIEIKVTDNGKGIPQNNIDKIFQPFFTTKPTGQGTGLGLSLAYDIIKAHGGELRVETKQNEGTVFIISLPS